MKGIKQILIYSISERIDRIRIHNLMDKIEKAGYTIYIFERSTKIELFVDYDKYYDAVKLVPANF